MLKPLLSIMLFLSSAASSFAEDVTIPTKIDYGKYPPIEGGYFTNIDSDAWNFGYYSFNYAPEVAPFFAFLKKSYKIDIVVETGTFQGGTTVLFSLLFDQVHTIEADKTNFANAAARLQNMSNVHCYFGSSDVVLGSLLPALKGSRILFYLDAHWMADWPLLNEIGEIAKTHKDNCIIVVDDIKVPGRRDIPYDAYGANECSLKYIQGQLAQAFTSYTVHYLIPKSVKSRAKLIVIPTQWAD